MVSEVFSALIKEAIMRGSLPEPDMFQYGDRMQMHMGAAENRRTGMATVLSGPAPDVTPAPSEDAIRLMELEVKKEHLPTEWTAADQEEHRELVARIYG
jgi:hypothetical protein